jgi:hypothetical protein
MSTIPANDAKRDPNELDRIELVSVPPANPAYDDRESPLLRAGRQHMRVKLCSRCPYTPRDLAGHYDPEAVLHVCAKCDGGRWASTNHYPRKVNRRLQCETFPNIPGTPQASGARSATENSVSYDTIPGKPPFVRGSALTASRHARTATADGCVDFTPPDNDCGETPATFIPKFRSLCTPPPERPQPADTAFCFALGGAT